MATIIAKNPPAKMISDLSEEEQAEFFRQLDEIAKMKPLNEDPLSPRSMPEDEVRKALAGLDSFNNDNAPEQYPYAGCRLAGASRTAQVSSTLIRQ